MSIDDYILNHIDPEPELLYRLYRDTNIRLLHGRMASGHLQGAVAEDARRDDSSEEHPRDRHLCRLLRHLHGRGDWRRMERCTPSR